MEDEFIKHNVKPLEIELQSLVAEKYKFTPMIFKVKGDTVHMQKINGSTLADQFTDDPSLVPNSVWNEIHRILSILYEREGIEFVDITSYNFKIDDENNKVWILDFGHAFYTSSSEGMKPTNWFLKDVLDGTKSYNPDFA